MWCYILPMAMGANKIETKSRHLVHMTSEVDLEVDREVLPAEPRRSCGELFLSQLSVPVTIQACRLTHREDLLIWRLYVTKLRCPITVCIVMFVHLYIHSYSLYYIKTLHLPLKSKYDASLGKHCRPLLVLFASKL